MKKYFLIGEDIDRTEITAEEAEWYRFDSDYKVVIEDDDAPVAATISDAAATPKTAEPDWEPFDFGDAPEGYRYTGYTITRYDLEGFETEMSSIPPDAVKTADPNCWTWQEGLCRNLIIAHPHYAIIETVASGECAGCKRMTCPRRQAGIRCRNYRKS